MSRQKPGRNEPCPCGSGRKYKVCHAAEDRAKRAAAVPAGQALEEDLKAAMDMLGGEDMSRVSAALEHLGELLTRWGPGPGLRFDAGAFGQHVSRELARLEESIERDAAQTHDALRLSTVRELGTRAFLEKLRTTLLTRATAVESSPEDRRALCLGALLSSTPERGDFRPEELPVLDVVFGVQFREWAARQGQELGTKLEARERSARVEAAMRERKTPSVFTPEEQVWLTSVLWKPLNALKTPGLDAKARSEAVSAFLGAVRSALDSDREMLPGMLERMRARAKDPALEETARAFFSDAAVAFEAEPVRMLLAAILTSASEPQARSAEEEVVRADLEARTRWTAEELEPYRELLGAMNLPGAAERIHRAQEWLRAHPITL